MRFIVDAGDAAPDAPVGGKARALAELLRAGFAIPRWFVVTPDAFWASLSERDRERFPVASEAELTAIVQRVQPIVDVANRIEAAVRSLAPDGRRLAVRSSASDEDGAQHSFAGQLESFLNVAHRDVAATIAAVWRSGFSERILAYRRAARPAAPAARAARCWSSGWSMRAWLASRSAPIRCRGRRNVAVVSAVPGLGTAPRVGRGRRGFVARERAELRHLAARRGDRRPRDRHQDADARRRPRCAGRCRASRRSTKPWRPGRHWTIARSWRWRAWSRRCRAASPAALRTSNGRSSTTTSCCCSRGRSRRSRPSPIPTASSGCGTTATSSKATAASRRR